MASDHSTSAAPSVLDSQFDYSQDASALTNDSLDRSPPDPFTYDQAGSSMSNFQGVPLYETSYARAEEAGPPPTYSPTASVATILDENVDPSTLDAQTPLDRTDEWLSSLSTTGLTSDGPSAPLSRLSSCASMASIADSSTGTIMSEPPPLMDYASWGHIPAQSTYRAPLAPTQSMASMADTASSYEVFEPGYAASQYTPLSQLASQASFMSDASLSSHGSFLGPSPAPMRISQPVAMPYPVQGQGHHYYGPYAPRQQYVPVARHHPYGGVPYPQHNHHQGYYGMPGFNPTMSDEESRFLGAANSLSHMRARKMATQTAPNLTINDHPGDHALLAPQTPPPTGSAHIEEIPDEEPTTPRRNRARNRAMRRADATATLQAERIQIQTARASRGRTVPGKISLALKPVLAASRGITCPAPSEVFYDSQRERKIDVECRMVTNGLVCAHVCATYSEVVSHLSDVHGITDVHSADKEGNMPMKPCLWETCRGGKRFKPCSHFRHSLVHYVRFGCPVETCDVAVTRKDRYKSHVRSQHKDWTGQVPEVGCIAVSLREVTGIPEADL